MGVLVGTLVCVEVAVNEGLAEAVSTGGVSTDGLHPKRDRQIRRMIIALGIRWLGFGMVVSPLVAGD